MFIPEDTKAKIVELSKLGALEINQFIHLLEKDYRPDVKIT